MKRHLAVLAALTAVAATASARANTPISETFEREARSGHTIEVFPDGESAHQARLELVRSAQRTIYFAAFAYYWDDTGKELGNALCKRAREGLDVRMLIDGIGARHLRGGADRYLHDCGVRVLFGNQAQRGLRNLLKTVHEKLLIADGERSIVGGSGVADHYRAARRDNPEWHDLDTRISGPAACDFQRIFGANWMNLARYSAAAVNEAFATGNIDGRVFRAFGGAKEVAKCEYKSFGDARVLTRYNNPLFSESRPLLDLHLEAIRGARHEILYYAPYFVPLPEVEKALIEAARAGKRVVVLTNSPWSNDEMAPITVAMYRTARRLVPAGVDVRIWKPKSTLHRKGAIFDGQLGYVGSDNLDFRGQNISSESLAWTDHPETVATLHREMELDLEQSIPLTSPSIRKYLKDIGFGTKLLAWLLRRQL